MKGYNYNDIKINNRYEIIQKVYQGTDVNRNSITRETGLTGAAITKIINSLINEKYISETNYFSSARNRRARYLSICEHTLGVLIFYFARNTITAAITDISGKILYSRDYSISYSMIDEIIITGIVAETMKHFPGNMPCIGCTCITPGIRCSGEAAIPCRAAKSFPYYWDIKKLQTIIEEDYRIPFCTENDTNAALLGEKWFGEGKDSSNFALYNIGKGTGAAVCVQGKLLKGYYNSSIEIGHVSINFEGPGCSCGNRGCLELYTSVDSWEKKLAQMPAFDNYTNKVESMFLNARAGDATSGDLVLEFAHMAAEGALILANLFSPEKIIVTTNESDYIYLPPIIGVIEEEINRRIFSVNAQDIAVEASKLRKNSYILGGIAVALENHFFTMKDSSPRTTDQ